MRILVVLTGGTIGSTGSNNIINVEETPKVLVVEQYRQRHGGEIMFETVSPFNLLSENISLALWEELVRYLHTVDFSGYDGVILTHGSDTLSYTAAVLAMAFAHISVPLVLAAANYPLEDERSNGLQNLTAALEFIRQGMEEPEHRKPRGVFVSYANQQEYCDIYLGTRLLEADGYFDKFGGLGGVPYARVQDGQVQYLAHEVNPAREEVAKQRPKLTGAGFALKHRVEVVRPYPGIDYRHMAIAENTAAVLHMAYHSGTACVKGDNSLLDLIALCKSRGIVLYLASLKPGAGVYQSAAKALEQGAVPLYNISLESAYAKLLLAYNTPGRSPAELVGKCLFFEHVPPGIQPAVRPVNSKKN